MGTERIPLTQPIETRDGTLQTDSKSVNGYFETIGAKREFVKRPGLSSVTLSTVLPDVQAQGLYLFKNNLYAVIANTLYEINTSDFVVTTIGTMTGTINGIYQTCYFEQTLNNTYLFLHNQVNAYVLDPTTNVLTQVKNDNIISATVLTGGTNYTNPSVTFSVPSGGGTRATGTVTTSGSSVTDIVITNGGSAYTAPLVVVGTLWTASTSHTAGTQVFYNNNLYTYIASGTSGLTPPTFTTGTAADGTAKIAYAGFATKATATVDSGVITGITINTQGTGYNAAPLITFTDSTGSSAAATASWQAGVVTGVVIVDGGSGYSSTETITITFSDPTGSGATAYANLNGFPVGVQLAAGACYLDTYTVVAGTNGEIYTSNPNDPTSWNALNYITAEAEPDQLLGIAKHLNYIVTFGQWAIDFFYDAGNYPGSPLSTAPSYHIEMGCVNGDSICSFDNTVTWIGRSKNTGPAVYALVGSGIQKISTVYIDRIISNSNMLSIRSLTTTVCGHTFYILTLHDINVTIVYDLSEQTWTQWTMYTKQNAQSVTGLYAEQYFRPSYTAGSGTTIYMLDDDNGTLYTLSQDYYSDSGASIYYRVVTDLVDNGTTKRKFYNRVEIVGDKVGATMNIRHTDDDYSTWSNYRTVDLNKPRSQIYQTGAARRRAWEFLCTSNQPLRLDCAEIDFMVGELSEEGVSAPQYRK